MEVSVTSSSVVLGTRRIDIDRLVKVGESKLGPTVLQICNSPVPVGYIKFGIQCDGQVKVENGSVRVALVGLYYATVLSLIHI